MKNVIYRIVNCVNGKVYVGSAVDFDKRKRLHLAALKKGTHHNRHLQAAWKLYGEQAFTFEVVEHATRETLLETEQRWIDRHQHNRYNLYPTAGSGLGSVQTPEAREKKAAALRGRKRVFTDEWKANISAAHRGPRKPLSEEHKSKVRASNLGKKRSEETKAKLRAAWERRKAR